MTDRVPAGNAKERGVLKDLSEEIRECLQHAEDCGRRAAAQTDAKMKADFLDLERRWLALARSYDFTEQLDVFCSEKQRRATDWPKLRHGT